MLRRPAVTPFRLLGAAILAAALLAGGCQAVGVMAEAYKRTGTHTVEAEYTDLEGRSYAVIISADRVIQASEPQLVPQLTSAVSNRLRAESGATGFVPGPVVLQYQYANPGWEARTYSRIAEDLGVERLIYIDLFEYRLFETGNSYLWDGLLAGRLGVVEADGAFPDSFAFERDVMVRFPDGTGYSPSDYTEAQIRAVLMSRFLDRSTWLFYDHEEPFYPDY